MLVNLSSLIHLMDDVRNAIICTRLPATNSQWPGYDWWIVAPFQPFGHRFIELESKERQQQ